MIFRKKIQNILVMAVLLFVPATVRAEDVSCFCFLDTDVATKEELNKTNEAVCTIKPSLEECISNSVNLAVSGKKNFTCVSAGSQAECKAEQANWKKQKIQALKNLEETQVLEEKEKAASKSQIIPKCATEEKWNPTSECADITIFIKLMLNIVNYLLSFVGGLALLFFIYGGFVLIFSSGSSEKLTQGKEIIMSALIGLVVTFSGYVLVSYLGYAVGITSTYMLQ